MVLSYYGIDRSMALLRRQLRISLPFGTSFLNIKRLRNRTIDVVIRRGDEHAPFGWLSKNVPLILAVEGGELAHHAGQHFQHAVVLIGQDDVGFWMHDPELASGPIHISTDELLLAWGEIDYRYAALVQH